MRTRAQAGSFAKSIGTQFEKVIIADLEYAHSQNIIAHWSHSEPTYRKAGPTFFPVVAGAADFFGCLTSGIALAIECKSRDERLYKREISETQQEHLDEVAKAGGLALLAVQFFEHATGGHAMHRFLIPWLETPWQKLKSAESIDKECMKEDTWKWCWRQPFNAYIYKCPSCNRAWPIDRACGCLSES